MEFFFPLMGYNPSLWLFVWMLNLSQIWPVEGTLSSVSFGFVPISFWTFPCFLAQNMPGSSCIFHASASNWPFSRELWVLLTFWHPFFHSPLLPKSTLEHYLFRGIPSHFSVSSLHTYSEWPHLFSQLLDGSISPTQSALPTVRSVYIISL